MKIALIGQDIPMLLPTLMTDLLFAGKEPADLALEEKNPAMQDLLRGYGDAVLRKAGIGGTLAVSDSRRPCCPAPIVSFTPGIASREAGSIWTGTPWAATRKTIPG